MDKEQLTPIKTSRGTLNVFRDWDREGAIYMENAQTVSRYIELRRKSSELDTDKFGVFFAFTKQRFNEKKEAFIKAGRIKETDEILSLGGGCYGTAEGRDKLYRYYDEINQAIKNECEPQEVYLFEWNNMECMFDDDTNCFELVEGYFGAEAASKITRFNNLF